MRPGGARLGLLLLWCWQLLRASAAPGAAAAERQRSSSQLGCDAPDASGCTPESSVAFRHGVASGDPLPDAVIIWTRLTPVGQQLPEAIPVKWIVWEPEAEGQPTARNGSVDAVQGRDFTVKVDVTGLRPRVRYQYRFYVDGRVMSPIGSFRLPPAKTEGLEELKYAVFSCSNWRWGLFNAYGAAAKKPLDFWLHVGDFIYENGRELYPNDKQAVRDFLDPPHELLSLDDYRRRYRLHRSDKNLQALSLTSPLIAIWDDHEVTNDAWQHGAKNHNDGEGGYVPRKMAALRAYHEWMPTRVDLANISAEGSPALWQSRRSFEFGNLASLVMLETRHTARSWQGLMTRQSVEAQVAAVLAGAGYPPPDQLPGTSVESMLHAIRSEVEANRRIADRHMIGPAQHAWVAYLADNVTADDVSWFLVAQPLLLQELLPAKHLQAAHLAAQRGSKDASRWFAALSDATGLNLTANSTATPPHLRVSGGASAKEINAQVSLVAGMYGINTDFDGWNGYAAARERLLRACGGAGHGRTIVYGGDTHNAWAGLVRNASSQVVLTQFSGASVSAPGLEFYRTWSPPDLEAAAWLAANEDLKWVNTHRRGFMYVHLNSTVQHLEYHGVNTTVDSVASECLAAFDVTRGTPAMTRVAC